MSFLFSKPPRLQTRGVAQLAERLPTVRTVLDLMSSTE